MAKIRDIQGTADHGRVLVDEQLQDLEARLTDLYARASHEAKKDLDQFLDKFYKEDQAKRAALKRGEITEEEYTDWRNRTIFRTEAMTAKVNDLTQQMLHADQSAMAMVNDQLNEVYATSWNFGGYRGETFAEAAGFDYTQFTIVNRDAVRILATKDPDLIPWKPEVDVKADLKWNREHIQSAIFSGIVKGDSIPHIADRLLPVVNMDRTAAIRTARTAVTGVENKGRKDATERVKEAGIPMVEAWSCTHDARTRDTHILMDGTLPNEAGFYGEGIVEGNLLEYPADPRGEPSEVYNCRCAIVSTIKGIDHSKDDELYAAMMEAEYYEDWLDVKEQREEKEAQFQEKRAGAAERVEARRERYQAMFEPNQKLDKANEQEDKIDPAEILPPAESLVDVGELSSGKKEVVQGEDISETWKRRTDEFEFAIDDIIDAQGFNGLPQIVTEEEFNEAVKESSFVAQRTYTAPTQEVLDSYREDLYKGDWYVDCSVGGAQYGQGMYVAADYSGEITEGITKEMEHYASAGGERILRSSHIDPDIIDAISTLASEDGYYGSWQEYALANPDKVEDKFGITIPRSYTETITLTSDAKIIEYDDIWSEYTCQVTTDDRAQFINDYIESQTQDFTEAEKIFIKFEIGGTGVKYSEAAEAYNQLTPERVDEISEYAIKLRKETEQATDDFINKRNEEAEENKKKYEDVGVYAASKGYDAINASGHGESGSYTVILNRSKVIIKEDKNNGK